MTTENNNQKSKIIVADDMQVINIQTKAILEKSGHHVIVAQDGNTVIKLAETEVPNLIILDIMMPGITGIETCKLLKQNPITKEIPVIFLTTKSDPIDLMDAFSSGCVDYINKPICKEELNSRVNTHLKLQKQLQQEHELQDLLRIKQEEAIRANELKDKFVTMVAHDLRSPYAAQLGYLELLLETDDNEAELTTSQKNIIQKVLKQGYQQLDMINNILDISRLQTGKIIIKPSFIEIDNLISQITNNYTLQAEQKKITLHNDVPKNHFIYADNFLLGEVIQNLISNALKFSNPHDVIKISASTGEKTRISIKDSGTGMTEKQISNLFKLEESTSTVGTAGERGTGFGLPYSQEIITGHNGNITVESSPGIGSTFHINLPLQIPQILLIDDEPIIHSLFSAFCNELNVNIAYAYNGKEAFQCMNQEKIHLIITDINMPQMNGFEFLSQVKQDPKTNQIPIIMMTSDESIESRTQCFNSGAKDYINKPIQKSDLIPRIRHAISSTQND